MDYVSISHAEYARLKREASLYREYMNRVSQAQLFVLAAARCGFTTTNQHDALILALHKLTTLELWVIELLLHIKPRQLR